jgi:SAM-dependent methyltransferase
VADAAAIHVPALVLAAGSDWVVRLGAQRRFFDGLASRIKDLEIYPGFFHAIFHERDRQLPIARTAEFIRARLREPAAVPSLADSDLRGPMRDEHDRLRAGGGRRHVAMKWGLRTVGLLSEGIRLGWRTGFDSGMTLDYVYENRPRGVTPVGRLIDRAYLRSLGWRGIRQRRRHLDKAIREAIDRVRAAGQAVHLLDVAAGPGRYVLEIVRSTPAPVTARLCDASLENLESGRRLADAMGLNGRVTFILGDALDRDGVGSMRPRPTVAVVSGLYELIPENPPVMTSLRGLADALEPGGYLIYTNQPWHPQIEFIAGALVNREGKPWIMRRRSQAEMDQLVAAAGFRKISMDIDRWGIFTVSLAERVAA